MEGGRKKMDRDGPSTLRAPLFPLALPSGEGGASTRPVCFGQWLGPGLTEINAQMDWDDIYEVLAVVWGG